MTKLCKTLCYLGLDCPYWGHEEDGMPLCTHPDYEDKDDEGNTVYPLISDMKMCPMVEDDSSLEKWLKSLDMDFRNFTKEELTLMTKEDERQLHPDWTWGDDDDQSEC